MSRSNGTPVDFVGDTGPGAVIDRYLPQPGQHVGRRILQIRDIPRELFRDGAVSAGVPWAEHLGLEQKDGVWDIARPEVLTAKWFNRYSRVTRLPRGSLGGLKATLNVSARSTLATQDSLVSWSRSGAGTAVRTSSRSDETGQSAPVQPVSTGGSGSSGSSGSRATRPPEEDAQAAFASSISEMTDGVIRLPTERWGGVYGEGDVDLEAPASPAFFLIQVVGISSFLGDYGMGRTVKTFTLLPGEVTNIHTRTWRATEESRSESTSIIDSFDESSAERFEETVLSETTDTATREQTENWYVDAEVKGTIGFASAKVSGGGGGEYASGVEEFARSLDEAVREHAAEASSHRENTVTSSSESSVSTEDEHVVERTIKNINVSRVLNFTFRELNQEYVTRTHLKDIRVAFSNGRAGSWREEPISGLRKLVEECVLPEHADAVCSDIIGTIAVVRDVNEAPVPVLDQVQLNACGTDFRTRDALPDEDCRYAAPTADGRLYYRFKRGPLGQNPTTEHPVDGVVLSERTLVMATDSVVVEALLGVNSALDSYSEGLQLEAVREKRLANKREALAQRLVQHGRDTAADLYQTVFGDACCTAVAPAEAAGMTVEEEVPA